MAKVLIPLAAGFEEIEALAVVDILRRAEIDVVLAGLQPGPVVGSHHIVVIPDATIDFIDSADFDMIVLPGGQPGTNNLNADQRIHRILTEFSAAGKPISAICAAPTVLAAAGLLSGRFVTCYPTCADKLGSAYYEDKPVVVDGTLTTARGAGAALEFAFEIVARLSGQQTADAVAHAMLVNVSAQHSVWDHQLFNSTIQALVGALELKDPYTQGHAKRVTEYALSIGSKLNLAESEMRDLYLGAILHDIGKIGTDEEVLNKPGSLSKHEEILVREHPLKGTLFIAGIENLSHIIPVILHHHEHWDGSGYPTHLKGEQIPLHARIVSVADAYDAMISNRSFRSGMTAGDAIHELIKKKDSQFDPFIVDVFVQCLNDSPYEIKDFSFYF